MREAKRQLFTGNPWHLSASDLMIWGLVLHLIAGWVLPNDAMVARKQKSTRLARVGVVVRHGLPRRLAPWIPLVLISRTRGTGKTSPC